MRKPQAVADPAVTAWTLMNSVFFEIDKSDVTVPCLQYMIYLNNKLLFLVIHAGYEG